MATTQEASEKKQEALDKVKASLVEKQQKLATAKTEKQRSSLIGQIGRLQVKIAGLELNLKELQAKQLDEQRAVLEEEILTLRLDILLEKLQSGDPKTIEELQAVARQVISLKQSNKELSGQIKDKTLLLKRLARAFPTGWTDSPDVYKRYRVLRIGQILIELQDNPEYDISWEDLLAWLGQATASTFIKVDKTALVKAIEVGEVTDFEGELVTMEDWEAKRIRTQREPKVVIVDESDSDKPKKILFVDPQGFNDPIDSLKGQNSIMGADLAPLKKANILTIGDLCRYSGEELLSIHGIGSIRARKVMDAVMFIKHE